MAEELFKEFSELSVEFDKKYKKEPNFIQRMSCWTAVMDNYLHPGDVVYDLGCGSGVFSFYAASKGAHVTGIDGSEGMINLCNEKWAHYSENKALKVSFVRETLPLKDSDHYPKADLIICSSMFEYMEEKERMIECYYALLKTGGILLVSVPNKNSVYRILEKMCFNVIGKPSYLKHVFNRFTYKQLAEEFGEHHFQPMGNYYYADNYLFSRLLKLLLPERFYGNLLLVVFKKNINSE